MERLTERGNPMLDGNKIREHSSELYWRLKAYEDAEEQGYCYRFPCKVGDVVYFHWQCSDETTIVYPAEVKEIRIGTYMLSKGIMFRIEPKGYAGKIRIFYHSDWGYCIFKSKEEAEKALEDMKGGE